MTKILLTLIVLFVISGTAVCQNQNDDSISVTITYGDSTPTSLLNKKTNKINTTNFFSSQIDLNGFSASDNDDDFGHYKYYYRKSQLNGWLGAGRTESSPQLKANFFSFYGEWLQKSNPKKKAFIGGGVSFGRYNFWINNEIKNKFDTSKTVFAGNGSELKISGVVNWSRESRGITNSFLKLGIMNIKQTAQDAYFDYNENYTLATGEFQIESNSNHDVAFNRTRLNFYAQFKLTENSEKTNYVYGQIEKGYVYNHGMFSGRFEQNVISLPVKGMSLAFAIAGVFQYTHLSEGSKDLYQAGAQLSIYYKYNEILMAYYGQQFDPSGGNNKSIYNQKTWWIALNVPEVFRAVTQW